MKTLTQQVFTIDSNYFPAQNSAPSLEESLVSVSHLPAGIYWLNVSTEKEIGTTKFIKL